MIRPQAFLAKVPDTMPFISFAIPQASYLLGGGHYIRGGSQVLSDRLVAIVREAGGACEVTRDASAILLEGDRVCGVRHHARDARDLQEDIAPIVFGNAAPSVLAAMPPEQARPSFSALYNDRCPSISLWAISLGLSRRSREFGVRRYSTAILPAWMMALADIRQAGAFCRDDPGTRIPPYSFVAYDQIDLRTEPEWPLSGVDGRRRSIDELGRSRRRRKADAPGTLDGSDHRRSR